MYTRVEKCLNLLLNARQQGLLKKGKIGLEREALRVSAEGNLARTGHPQELGSPLTHPWITTDFSEALIEFITPPFSNPGEVLAFLGDTQAFAYEKLNKELLWGTSMPCILAGEKSIPLARYGSSNAGTMKLVYRRGLGYRYGRVMQVIAGVHFNYSINEALWPVFQGLQQNTWMLQDFISESYFGMIRNLQRFGWIIPYLFGASPAVCATYLQDRPTNMQLFDDSTYYYPYATSLRMGDIGYQNNKESEAGFKARYDNLNDYVASLTRAIETPCPKYEKIGVVVNGQYRQLNANMLQIENEYYSTVRPKQVLNNNEKPSLALRDRGVRYVELRSLDINGYDPLGITEKQLRFLEAFMIFCLFQKSPRIGSKESREIDMNEVLSAQAGRDPALMLRKNGHGVSLRSWAREICTAMQGICQIMDEGERDNPYTRALNRQFESIEDPDRTPSAIMIKEMRDNKEGFHEFAKRLSLQHQEYFKRLSLSAEKTAFFTELASSSIREQIEMEQADNISFDEYLKRYFAQC